MDVRHRIAALVAAGALTLAGCGDAAGDAPAGPDDPSPAAAPAAGGTADDPTTSQEPATSDQPAAESHDFTARTLDGATFDGRSLAGKPAVLWFWAPWCTTCLGQADRVNALAADYGDRATVLGVAGLDGEPAMRDFVALAKLAGFAQLSDEQGVVWKKFGITAQSTFVVLDAAGEVVDRGHVDVDELPGTLDRLLAD
ncbi:redoxin domain-containing protein [Solwaraspora sp. WMMA2056]|uniref:redoxin domain-containing protein n=1 Tax=Solwaraspora sp. WMMA2056 TaxID=3015161 RepID=UPI00259B7048|nr:redoxin domain-containing protein [Solwaraspora sp. WMMA2056]WJK40462.1 redoxin domain-containing protein [Solwaraspora sp. WMMA2056]